MPERCSHGSADRSKAKLKTPYTRAWMTPPIRISHTPCLDKQFMQGDGQLRGQPVQRAGSTRLSGNKVPRRAIMIVSLAMTPLSSSHASALREQHWLMQIRGNGGTCGGGIASRFSAALSSKGTTSEPAVKHRVHHKLSTSTTHLRPTHSVQPKQAMHMIMKHKGMRGAGTSSSHSNAFAAVGVRGVVQHRRRAIRFYFLLVWDFVV